MSNIGARTAINRRVNNPQNNIYQPQISPQIPQNRVINNNPNVGFQQNMDNMSIQQQQLQQQQLQQQQQQQQQLQQQQQNNQSTIRQSVVPLQQSFDLVFNKINSLDKNIKDLQQLQQEGDVIDNYVDKTSFNGLVEEFNSRTEMLASEISEIKDMLLKTQNFNMEINNKLLNLTLNK